MINLDTFEIEELRSLYKTVKELEAEKQGIYKKLGNCYKDNLKDLEAMSQLEADLKHVRQDLRFYQRQIGVLVCTNLKSRDY